MAVIARDASTGAAAGTSRSAAATRLFASMAGLDWLSKVWWTCLSVGLFAGIWGVVIAYPLVGIWLPRWLADATGGLLPAWEVSAGTCVLAAVVGVVTSLLGGALPGWRATGDEITTALRHVG